MTGSAPLPSLLTSDFWGVPLSHGGSHKSYRPLTSLSFHLDWLLAPGSAAQFHLTNVLLHALATHLFHRLLLTALPAPAPALTAALLFAAHPVHTEAVAGIVGRAELLSAVFFLLSLLAQRSRGWGLLCALLAASATLAKEQGVTVLGVSAVLELLAGRSKKNLLQIGLSLVAILSLRAAALGGSLPSFSKADNPASHSSSLLTRSLTFLHLPARNCWLLLCPSSLSFDWSMDSIPLITSFSDTRNILSLLPYTLVTGLLLPLLPSLLPAFSLTKRTSSPSNSSSNTSPLPPASTTIFALALTILPFLPATNLFFYIGFVMAERLLYLPSMGFCLLAALGLHKFSTFQPNLTRISFTLLLVVSSFKTVIRNGDWASEKDLFTSGLSINPAKSLSNLGTVLHNQGKLGLAEAAFREALERRGNMADTHFNLGILLQGQGRLREAEHAYKAAIRYDQG